MCGSSYSVGFREFRAWFLVYGSLGSKDSYYKAFLGPKDHTTKGSWAILSLRARVQVAFNREFGGRVMGTAIGIHSLIFSTRFDTHSRH